MKSQLTLFAPATPIERNFLGIAGLDYWPFFLSVPEQAKILKLVNTGPWLHDLKRRVQHFGYRYDYKARRLDKSMYVGPLPAFAKHLADRLVEQGLVNEAPDQLIVNEYLPGQGITPHIDCEPCFSDTIVTISLGAVYLMEFTDTESCESKEVDLGLGSALVLRGEARYRWKHGIKQRRRDGARRRGRRVSLTFRKVILDA
jgi:alkylated DNA repair dioxygenase AlkB